MVQVAMASFSWASFICVFFFSCFLCQIIPSFMLAVYFRPELVYWSSSFLHSTCTLSFCTCWILSAFPPGTLPSLPSQPAYLHYLRPPPCLFHLTRQLCPFAISLLHSKFSPTTSSRVRIHTWSKETATDHITWMFEFMPEYIKVVHLFYLVGFSDFAVTPVFKYCWSLLFAFCAFYNYLSFNMSE